ncbi:secreted protein [Pelomyxa schiedti]|nr:secreted protein [Pelomyxa schiedti]
MPSFSVGGVAVWALVSLLFVIGSSGVGSVTTTAVDSYTLSGYLTTGCPDFVSLPFEVPDSSVSYVAVSYWFSDALVPPGVPGNALDIGLWDERGVAVDAARVNGWRGWTGSGSTSTFGVGSEEAALGYVSGQVNPGVWNVVLGPYTVAPEGLWYQVNVTLQRNTTGSATKSQVLKEYPPDSVAGRGRDWYRGQCHLHTVHSDGSRTPEQVAAEARELGIDFFAATDHNTISSQTEWGGLWGDDLLILCGEELTTRNGHCVAFATDAGAWFDFRFRAKDGAFPDFAASIGERGGVVIAAHPHSTCLACRWSFTFDDVDLLEVWNGPWTPDDEQAVSTWESMLLSASPAGWRPAHGGSDSHGEGVPLDLPNVVVLADELSRDAVVAGMKAGHSYIAESTAVSVNLTAATTATGKELVAGIGCCLCAPADTKVSVTLTVSGGPDGGTARIMTEEGVMHDELLRGGGGGTIETFLWETTVSLATYVRAEIRHPSMRMVAMTNPIFLGEEMCSKCAAADQIIL